MLNINDIRKAKRRIENHITEILQVVNCDTVKNEKMKLIL